MATARPLINKNHIQQCNVAKAERMIISENLKNY